MSQSKNRSVTVYKNPKIGVTPGEVLLAQRHFEKEIPAPLVMDEATSTFNVPVDLLDIATPNVPHGNIKSINAVYERRK